MYICSPLNSIHLVDIFFFQVPSVEVNALMKSVKMKPLMFPVRHTLLDLFGNIRFLHAAKFISVCFGLLAGQYLFVHITDNI